MKIYACWGPYADRGQLEGACPVLHTEPLGAPEYAGRMDDMLWSMAREDPVGVVGMLFERLGDEGFGRLRNLGASRQCGAVVVQEAVIEDLHARRYAFYWLAYLGFGYHVRERHYLVTQPGL